MKARESILSPKLLRSIGSYYLYDILTLISMIVLTRVLLRYLGQAYFGLFITVSATLGYLKLLDLGLAQTLAKYTAEYIVREDHEGLNETINTTLALYIGLALVGFVASALILPFFDRFFSIPPPLVRLGAIYFSVAAMKVCLSLPLSLFPCVCFGMGQVEVYNINRSIGVALNFILTLLAIYLHYNLAQMEALTIVAPITAAIVSGLWMKKLYGHIRFSWDYVRLKRIRKLFNFSVYFMVNQLIVLLVFQTDSIVIGNILGVASVSTYYVTQKVIQGGLDITFKISDALFPTWSALDSVGDYPKVRNIYLAVTKYSLATALVIATLITFYGRWLILAWTGKDGDAGFAVILTLALLIPLHTPVHVASGLLAAVGQLKKITPWSIVEGLLNLALSIWLAHTFQILGVALGTLISMTLTCGYIVPHIALQTISLSWKDYLMKAIGPACLAALPSLVVVVFFQWRWAPTTGLVALIQALVSGGVFTIILLWLSRGKNSLPPQ